jgi:hypothetical protein
LKPQCAPAIRRAPSLDFRVLRIKRICRCCDVRVQRP